MSPRDSTNRSERYADLIPLIDAVAHDAADAEAIAALEARLLGDAEAQRFYLDYAAVHLNLAWQEEGGSNSELGTRNSERAGPRPIVVSRWSFRIPGSAYALAAAVAIAAGAVAVYLVVANGSVTERPVRGGEPVATVTDATENATLVVDDQVMVPGSEFRVGAVLLDAGAAEFSQRNGVAVRLSGPTRLVVHDPTSATLMRGSASFDCPPSVAGYTVNLPGGAKVVDLGTAFGVEVDEAGEIEVRVTEGRVRVQTRGVAGSPGRSVELAADQSVVLADEGRTPGPVVTRVRPVRYEYVGALRPGGGPSDPGVQDRRDDSLTELTDGVIGGGNFSEDFAHVGVIRPDRGRVIAQPAILFDLGESRAVDAITITYLVDHEAAIGAPSRAVVRTGDGPDALGEAVEAAGFDDSPDPPAIREGDVRTHTLRVAPRPGRYLRLDLYGDREWVFISEIEMSRSTPWRADGPAERDPRIEN